MFYLGVFIVTAGIVTGICSLLPLDGVSRLIAYGVVCLILPPLIMYPLYRILPEAKSAFLFVKNVIRIGIK